MAGRSGASTMQTAQPGAPSREQVFADYISYYRERGLEGKLGVCRQAALREKARQFLASASHLPEGLPTFHFSSLVESCCLGGATDRERQTCRRVVQALEFLELICVNLFLSPWRREIKSLKTFTGTFVYSVRSGLPGNLAETVLEKLGYAAVTATEFSLVRKIEEEEAKQIAFEMFLARMECEIFLEESSECCPMELWEGAQTGGRHDLESMLMPEKPDPPQRSPGGSPRIPGGESGEGSSQNPAMIHNAPAPGPTTCVSGHLSGRGSDSEEFLSRYSDIFIGQTPVFPEDCSPGRQRRPLATGPAAACEQLILSSGAAAARPITPLLLPGDSGPQALAMFVDVPSGRAQAPGLNKTLEWLAAVSNVDSFEEEEEGKQEGEEEKEVATSTRLSSPPGHQPEAPTPRALCSPLGSAALEQDPSSEDELGEVSSSLSQLDIRTASNDRLAQLGTEPNREGSRGPDRPPRGSPCPAEGEPPATGPPQSSELAADPCSQGPSESRQGPEEPSDLQRATLVSRHVREPPGATYVPPGALAAQCAGNTQPSTSPSGARPHCSEPRFKAATIEGAGRGADEGD
ncbi:uncharacterized protein LOC114806319 [Ornithorhynchus anatinus]|uniref:Spermatogenesis-associated protein 2 PUB-like domain-containing protein n=1 Tax=Ornithorhynchus anatinus TaxID=9258 RepID=A0A6I8P0B3_ORNAN|nr:uncharacterized protein LOC114806319 [Ornithorhynchus anatinus]